MNDGEIGVVLSGGGANGAYEIGVLKALFEGASPATGFRPIDPGVFTGTSTGAYNATVLVGQAGVPAYEALALLEEIWLTRIADTLARCGNGVFRIRAAPLQILDPGCLERPVRSLVDFGRDVAELSVFGAVKTAEFLASSASLGSRLVSLVDVGAFISNGPFLDLIRETVDLDGLSRSERLLTIVASNWARGTPRLFSKQEMSLTVGPSAVAASAALPGFFPPVEIEGEPYVDGGVLINTPLKPAIRDGARELHVVFLDPLIENVRLPPLPSTADVLYLLIAIIWAARMREDARRAAAINSTIRLLFDEVAQEDPEAASRFLEVGRRVWERHREGRPYRKLAIHFYRPTSVLGGGSGLLDFEQSRLEGLIERGFADAVAHDCLGAGCVLREEQA